ncbi:MAG: hypothetical protein AAF432_16320 [Planctomycetota bacterium]
MRTTRRQWTTPLLAANAVLLGGVLLVQMNQTPAVASSGIPNAAGQRAEMINELRALRADINELSKNQDRTNKLLGSGTLRVRVE